MAKICPSCGYPAVDDQSLFCNKCGYPFPRNLPEKREIVKRTDNRVSAITTNPRGAEPRTAPAAVRQSRRKKPRPAGFLSFNTLITENSLKRIYILGAVGIILVSLMGIAGMFAKPVKVGTNVSITNTTAIAEYPAGSPLFWIGFLVAGSVLWRMFCELFVMLSRVHGAPGYGEEIAPDDGAESSGEEEWAAVPAEEGPTQYVECPRCRKIVTVDQLWVCEHCGVQGCSNCIRMMGLLKKTMTCKECFEAK